MEITCRQAMSRRWGRGNCHGSGKREVAAQGGQVAHVPERFLEQDGRGIAGKDAKIMLILALLPPAVAMERVWRYQVAA
eukprot:6767420-Pyramimonas_sp.AAC.1